MDHRSQFQRTRQATGEGRSRTRRSVAVALLAGQSLLAQGSAVYVQGVVVEQGTGAPLQHSMVTLQPVGRQTFTDDEGRFTLAGVPPGRHRLRAAHLGYAPVDIDVVVRADSAPARIRVELQRISLQLSTVRVAAFAKCLTPGPPDPEQQPDFAMVFGQLALNAEQSRLVSDSFPYAYRLQRVQRQVRGDSIVDLLSVDTLFVQTDRGRWRYEPGKVVTGGMFTNARAMYLPTLEDFASAEFERNHCFSFGGRDDSADGALVRIDFRAADRIHVPDVNGAFLLDAASYQIRRAELFLSRMPGGSTRLAVVRVTTVFREIQRGILAFSDVHAVRTFVRTRSLLDPVEAVEDQVLLDFSWIRAAPGAPTAKP
jgi:hypothetical protein